MTKASKHGNVNVSYDYPIANQVSYIIFEFLGCTYAHLNFEDVISVPDGCTSPCCEEASGHWPGCADKRPIPLLGPWLSRVLQTVQAAFQ